jgi:tetratricopeptide (TPR) repeat protein
LAAFFQEAKGFQDKSRAAKEGCVNLQERDAFVEESTRLMASGFDAMAVGDWRGAAGIFQKAANSRELLPWRTDAEAAWLLSAAWLNLGDVLLRQGDQSQLEEALRALDRTIEVMRCIELSANPAYVDRLILTWLNRAMVFHDMESWEEAFRSYSAAETLLREWGESSSATRSYLAGMLRVNRARTLVHAARPLEAWKEAGEGISRMRSISPANRDSCIAGILARSIRCRALVMLLDVPGGTEEVGDWIAQATDSAEEALAMVRETGFRSAWLADLVSYGAIIYRRCQPHFLGEFLAEWLTGDGPLAEDQKLKEQMKNQLWLTLADAERQVLEMPQDTEFVAKQTRIVLATQKALRLLE